MSSWAGEGQGGHWGWASLLTEKPGFEGICSLGQTEAQSETRIWVLRQPGPPFQMLVCLSASRRVAPSSSAPSQAHTHLGPAVCGFHGFAGKSHFCTSDSIFNALWFGTNFKEVLLQILL